MLRLTAEEAGMTCEESRIITKGRFYTVLDDIT